MTPSPRRSAAARPPAGSWRIGPGARSTNPARATAAWNRPSTGGVTRAFIEACSTGDLDALMGVLDRDVSGEVDARSGVVTHGADRVARNILGYWGRPDTVLVPQPVCGQPAVLAFVNRRLAGLLALSIDDGRITKIHVLVRHSTLEPLRTELG